MTWQQIFPVVLAFLLASLLTPVARRLALVCGLVDDPDGNRKQQQSAVPLGGGVAILLAFLAAIGITLLLGGRLSELLSHDPRFLALLCGAAAVICLAGLLDDRYELRGRQKLLAQTIAALLVISGGLVIKRFVLFDMQVELGVMSIPFTLLWLLGAINALNLIDGIDGLAGTVGVILSIAMAAMAAMTNHPADSTVCLILGGSVLGFLIYNLPPAKIYLGDAGSMLIGLVLGALAIRCSLKEAATVALAAPTAIWAILAFDIVMAIVRRRFTGRSIYTTDRAHLHHVLRNRGYSVGEVLLIVGLLCATCAAGALLSIWLANDLLALAITGVLLGTLVFTGFFGRAECGLAARKALSLTYSLGRFPMQTPAAHRPVCSRFHGNREWESLWQSLVEYADRFDLSQVRLNISSPAIGEEYHAFWERKAHPPLERLWQTEIPLSLRGMCVGRLNVVGGASDGAVVAWMAELIDGLRPFEIQLIALLEETTFRPTAARQQAVELDV